MTPLTSRPACAETFSREAQNPAVCVVDGFGLRFRVERGHLEIADGLGHHRRVRRFAKATHGLSRVVIIGSTGMLSLNALRWCAGAGIAVVVLDPSDGSVLSTSGQFAVDDGRLRRAQAMALGTDAGMAIARYLIGVKLGRTGIGGHRRVGADQPGFDHQPSRRSARKYGKPRRGAPARSRRRQPLLEGLGVAEPGIYSSRPRQGPRSLAIVRRETIGSQPRHSSQCNRPGQRPPQLLLPSGRGRGEAGHPLAGARLRARDPARRHAQSGRVRPRPHRSLPAHRRPPCGPADRRPCVPP